MVLRNLYNNSGIGLMEVMIGMIVIGIGLLGLAPMLTVSIDGNAAARDSGRASNLIKEKIEYYEGLPADSIPSVPYASYENNLGCNSNDDNDDYEEGSNRRGYARITTINDHSSDSSVPEDLYEIKVEIQWTDITDVAREVSFSTFLLKE